MNLYNKPVLETHDYNPASCAIGIVHIGFGAFHRAHQSLYIDQYMGQTRDLRWGIAAVNLRGEDSTAFANATQKDGYVLKTITPQGKERFQLIRAHSEFHDWSKDARASEALVALSSVKILTMTVTESGYYLDNDFNLNPDDPTIAAETSGTDKRSIYAYLRAGLNERRLAGGEPISILCCDNLRGNGHLLERNFKTYLELCGDQNLLSWLETNASFPASMVDRITPKTPDSLPKEVDELFERDNDASILGEDFIQWVIEDNFVNDRPELEKVGVTITKDIDPFEETKIRILNGGHTCLAYLGVMDGYRGYDELMAVDHLFEHFWNYETKEVLPALDLDVPFSKMDYLKTVMNRFKNPHIADSLERICTDGFAKFPIFVGPTIRGCFAQNIVPHYAIDSVASWYVFARHALKGKLPIPYHEPNWDSLLPLIEDGKTDDFIASEILWGDIPETYPEFASSLSKSIKEMELKWPV